jgi:phosphate transport system protein
MASWLSRSKAVATPGEMHTGREHAAVAEPRREFDRQLDAIELKVIELFAMVCEDLAGVTDALVSGNVEVTGQLAERDQAIDALYRQIEQLATRAIVLQAPVASDLRFLLTVLRIAPELERSHDLECEIAAGTSLLIAADLSSRCRGLTGRMGELACDMWGRAANCWYEKDGSAAPVLAKINDEMHELHTSLVAELASDRLASPVTIEMALIARFYERLGDHAVNIARRVGYLAGSSH